MRGARVEIVEAADAPARLPTADLVVDAAYGTGFRGEHTRPTAGDAPVLAVDIPSGVDGLTGAAHGRALAATRTVTFAALKPGLVLEPGRSLAGPVVVADIGLDVGEPAAGLVTAPDVRGVAALPRDRDATSGRPPLLVVAGSAGMTGAAHLAAAAAQRAGAGMVRLGSPGVSRRRRSPGGGGGLRAPRRRMDRARRSRWPRGSKRWWSARASAPVRPRRRPSATWSPAAGLPAAGRRRRADRPRTGCVVGARRPGRSHRAHAPRRRVRTTHREPGPEPDRLDAARAPGGGDRRRRAPQGADHRRGRRRTACVRMVTSGDARLATAGTGRRAQRHHRRPPRPGAVGRGRRRRRRVAPRSSRGAGSRHRDWWRPTSVDRLPEVLDEVMG